MGLKLKNQISHGWGSIAMGPAVISIKKQKRKED
jgi:hypothetical protein